MGYWVAVYLCDEPRLRAAARSEALGVKTTRLARNLQYLVTLAPNPQRICIAKAGR